MVESRVPDLRLFRQQVPGLTGQRKLRIEHGTQDPYVEVGQRGGESPPTNSRRYAGVPPTME